MIKQIQEKRMEAWGRVSGVRCTISVFLSIHNMSEQNGGKSRSKILTKILELEVRSDSDVVLQVDGTLLRFGE